jgi:hypothetical protein
MFKRDAHAIRSASQTSPDVTARTIQFAIVTANAGLHHAVEASSWLRTVDLESIQYEDIPRQDISLMAAGMSRAKLSAVKYVWAHREDVYAQYQTLDPVAFWHYAVDTLPGLGLTKAAFAVQMLYNEMGCLDTHNLRDMGVSPQAVAGYSRPKREMYLALQATRTSETWWNVWCDFIAKKYAKRYTSGDEVSALHVTATIG